eukprot:6795635-Alexandrium_andersonii.AAC.1
MRNGLIPGPNSEEIAPPPGAELASRDKDRIMGAPISSFRPGIWNAAMSRVLRARPAATRPLGTFDLCIGASP